MATKKIDMCNGPLFKKIILYTLPIMVTGVLQLLFNAADLVVVGQFGHNEYAVAAIGATSALATLFVNLFIGISTGCAVTTAHAIGSGDHVATKRAVHTSIPTAIICGVIIAVLGILLCRPMLVLMGTTEEHGILGLATLYLRIYFGGMIFNMVYNFGAAILRAAGDTQSPLKFLTVSGILNVLLNVLFVTVFKMDVAGVAIATMVSQALSATLVIIALMKRSDDCRLVLRDMRIHGRTLSKILRIGIPSGIQSSLFAISNVIIQSSINSFESPAILAGNTAAASIEGFSYIMMNAFYQTTLNFVGQNDGAKKYDRIKRVLFICMGCTMTIGIVSGIVIYIFADPLLHLYIRDSSLSINDGLTLFKEQVQFLINPGTAEQVAAYNASLTAIDAGIIKLAFVCVPYFFCGMMESATGTVRGLGCSFTPMITTVLSVCGVRILWIYTIFQIPQYHSLPSLFISYPLSWMCATAFQLLIFLVVYKKRKRLTLKTT
ncbi:MAG: MATE family efflux transporter [Clostridia bacterium]|nr:MATE family efflux transporter [Clostridia bacterium]